RYPSRPGRSGRGRVRRAATTAAKQQGTISARRGAGTARMRVGSGRMRAERGSTGSSCRPVLGAAESLSLPDVQRGGSCTFNYKLKFQLSTPGVVSIG